MSRINTSRFQTRPKHEQSAIELTRVVADLRALQQENAAPDPVTRAHMIIVIGRSRRDLERCSTPLSDLVRYQKLFDPHMSDHADTILTLTHLSVRLKLNEQIYSDMLDVLTRQINELDNCREDLRFS